MTFQPTNTTELVADTLFDLGAMVDAYGDLKAQIAALEAKANAIKAALQATGRSEFREGKLFDATMSISNRETISVKDARAHFGPAAEAIIKTSADSYTLRCTAKKAKT